jgi:hypothetical protein
MNNNMAHLRVIGSQFLLLHDIHTNPMLADMDNKMAHLREIGSRVISDASGNTQQPDVSRYG